MAQRRVTGHRAAPRVGVVAVQGAFREHRTVLERLGAESVEVRAPRDLEGVEALVLPGGESTTMSLLLESAGLWEPLAERLAGGVPVLATCAGLILTARDVRGGRQDQRSFGVLDVVVERNAYGRQVDSFEAGIEIAGLEGGAFPAVFIRAPMVVDVGQGVEVLACVDGKPVLVRDATVLAATFHPELSGDTRLHERFLGGV